MRGCVETSEFAANSVISFFALFHPFHASSFFPAFFLTVLQACLIRCLTRHFDCSIPRLLLLTSSNTAAPIFSLVAPGSRSYDVSRICKIPCKEDIKERLSVSFGPVYKLVKQIPRGRVLTYGALARALRLPGGARTAGRAMGATPRGKAIPWHRVLGANGKILTREPYASLQKKLLESEGIQVIESRINLKKHLWTPPRKKSSAAQNNRNSITRR